MIATEEAESILESVAKVTESTAKIKAGVAKIKESAEILVQTIEVETGKAQVQLEAAQPALDEAAAALNVISISKFFKCKLQLLFTKFFQTITTADIATVRKLGKPPYLITLIMDVCLILFRRKIKPVKVDVTKKFIDSSWDESLKVMAESGFLSKILRYPKDSINAEIIDLMAPYLTNE